MPADQWEHSFTNAVVRNIAQLRTDSRLTIEQFARACDQVVGEPGRFKPNTLQALFAGKRKGVTVAELVVFAAALDVPVISLLIPPANTGMPALTGRQMAPLDVWTLVTGEGEGSVTEVGQSARYELGALAQFAMALSELRSNLAAFYYFSPEYDGSATVITPREAVMGEIRSALRECGAVLSGRPDLAGHSDPVVEWVRTANPNRLTEESVFAIARVIVDSSRDELTAKFVDIEPFVPRGAGSDG